MARGAPVSATQLKARVQPGASSIPNSTLSFSKARPALPTLDKADLSQGRVLPACWEKNLATPLDSFSHQNTPGPLIYWLRFSYDSLFGFLFIDFCLACEMTNPEMCLLHFCPFKTVLNEGSKERQEDGRGCGGISCWAMSGIQWLWTRPKFGSNIQGTGEHFLEAEGYWSVPFLLTPSQLLLSQLHLTG